MARHNKHRTIAFPSATTCRELVGGYYVCASITSTDIYQTRPFFAAQQILKNGSILHLNNGLKKKFGWHQLSADTSRDKRAVLVIAGDGFRLSFRFGQHGRAHDLDLGIALLRDLA